MNGGTLRRPRLSVEDEQRLTREVEEAEADMVRAIVRVPGALTELVLLGDGVRAGSVRTRDVIRVAEQAPGGMRARRERLLEVLETVGRFLDGGERAPSRRLEREIAALRLQPGVLERAGAKIGEEAPRARVTFERARVRVRRAKSEWTAKSAYLVLAIARRYRRPGVDTVDLVQDGNIGLIRAVEKFDASLGHRFHAYAAWWIRQHIFRALASYGRTIRVPLPMVEASHRVARARRIFEGIHGTEPDDAELAAASGVDQATVAAVSAIADEPVSFHGRIGDEETSVLDRIPDGAADLPDEIVGRARLEQSLRSLFDALAPHERDVLRLRFGLDGGQEHTPGEVAASLGLSRERARRVEEHALAKLRAWSARGGLGGVAA